jgi:hypothetical protein
MSTVRIRVRRDTAANWTAVNPVLLGAELGYETDTRKLKFGDGTSAWNSLPYFGGSSITVLNDLVDVDTTAKVNRSVLYYDSAAGVFKADGLVTTNELTDGGNF